jgi:hypothetical protein
LAPSFGVEVRGDGGSGLSLASPQVMKFVDASRK